MVKYQPRYMTRPYEAKHMKPMEKVKNAFAKNRIMTRTMAGFLTIVMVCSLVGIINFSEFFSKTASVSAVGSEDFETSAYYVNNRYRKDGLYSIRSVKDPTKVISVEGDSVSAGGYMEMRTDEQLESQLFVLQINERQYGETSAGSGVYNNAGGYDSENNIDTARYGIRPIKSLYWLHGNAADGDDGYVQQRCGRGLESSYPNYRDNEGLWRFIHNDDGTYYITLSATGEYLYAESTASGTRVRVVDAPQTLTDDYKWNLTQEHLPDSFLTEGSYYMETYSASGYGGVSTTPAALLNNYVCGINSDSTLIVNEIINKSTGVDKTANLYMQFKLQKTSGGFYTITNLATGKFLACEGSIDAENPTNREIILKSGQDSGNYPTVNERWIIYPTTNEGNNPSGKVTIGGTTYTSTAQRFRIISAANGHQITNTLSKLSSGSTALTTGLQAMQNVDRQTWNFKSVTKQSSNLGKGKTVSGDTGVYADTFDVNDTVTIPIRIFDYAADGMLFEYASITSSTEYLDYGGKTYRMGNNNSFTMQSRSSGGTSGAEWHQGNFNTGWADYIGDGSATFYYNKYWAPYVSGMKFTNDNGAIIHNYNNPQLDLSSDVGGYFASGHTSTNNPAIAVAAGTMGSATAGIDCSNLDLMTQSLSFPLLSTQTFGTATIGLTESNLREISVDTTDDGIDNPQLYKLPQYRQQTVEYIAVALQRALAIEYKTSKAPDDSTQVYNYNYVDGETSFADVASGLDLAALLRGDTAADPATTAGVLEKEQNYARHEFKKFGSYAETLAKSSGLIGTWNQVKGNIDTCMDAAYWMLNSIFLENSYNKPRTEFNSLVLTKVTDHDGREGYIFDSTFIDNSSSQANVGESSVEYDAQAGTIRNTSAAGKSFTYRYDDETGYTASYPFTPVRDANGNQTATQSPYPMDTGVSSSDMVAGGDPEYAHRNYNFVLQSNASFIYHADDQLYFQFEGDDDVYLFINNELVVDIGGAHAVVGTKMYLNDYVEWAWEVMSNPSAYSAKEVERAEKLALVEGNSYSFDFYYMERHGYGSNMRIFTNFQLTDTQLGTKKTAYQDNQEIPYGGVVASDKKVEYGFKLENKGNSNLYCLCFDDADIGVTLDWHKGIEIKENSIVTDVNGDTLDPGDLALALTSPDGTIYTVTGVENADDIKNLLHFMGGTGVAELSDESGLLPGWAIEIRGIYYTLTEEQISDGLFTNILNVKAYTEGGNPDGTTNGSELRARSDSQVRVHSKPLYYHWNGHQLAVSLEEFINDVTEATNDNGERLYPVEDVLNAETFRDMYLCGPTGIKTVYPYARIDSDYTMYFNYPNPGGYHVSVNIIYEQDGEHQNLIVPFSVFVTSFEDRVVVLDYGLGADLTENGSLVEGDVLTATGRNTSYEIFGISDVEPSYGDNNIDFTVDADGVIDRGIDAEDIDNSGYGKYTFDSSDSSLRYDPSQFMEGADRIWVSARVSENMDKTQSLGNVDINEEVEMYKSVTVIPANVVYYEDTFASVNYEGATSKNTIEVFGSLSDSVSSDQGISRDENYGFDEKAYAADNNIQMSHGVCTRIPVLDEDNDPTTLDTAASFTFTGTGFELICRTNAKDSAIVIAEVYNKDGELVRELPVITEFDHGADGGDEEIYQVPVVRIDGLEHGSYTVKIVGVPTYDFSADVPVSVLTYLYVDGVRIYNPIQGSEYEDFYDKEKGAIFEEVRGLVFDGKAIGAKLSGETASFTYGDVYITEDRNKDDSFVSSRGGLSQFFVAGPNNEVYIETDTEGEDNFIILNVRETENTPYLLQVGVHDIDEKAFYGVMNAYNAPSYMSYCVDDGGTYRWTDKVKVQSGTEQYYTIDYRACPVVDGYYQVIIKVEGFISFTNVKYNNLEFRALHSFTPDENYVYVDGELVYIVENGDRIPVDESLDYPNLDDIKDIILSADGYVEETEPVTTAPADPTEPPTTATPETEPETIPEGDIPENEVEEGSAVVIPTVIW